ncbi:ROK family transcriptional regulator [Nonomuraea recticatena]|uniref:ROK family transcriptional regulator n=1 Tax=Nonomuraea recticatena TaxID=46178 RepID=UPI00361EF11F
MRQVSGDASLLRRLNSAAILRIMRASEDATLTELARAARVSRPTAEGVVDDLLAEGWAEECVEEQGDRQRGRPARRFRFRASAAHVVGVSIGHSGVRATVSDLNGGLVSVRRRRLAPDTAAPDRLAATVEQVWLAAADAEIAVGDLVAVGVGTTGVVDGEGRVVKSIALPCWTGLHLQAELGARLPVPVVVENDMRLAVLAEHWRGAAQGRSNVVYLFTGNRIGMGLLIGGVPYRGRTRPRGRSAGSPTTTGWPSGTSWTTRCRPSPASCAPAGRAPSSRSRGPGTATSAPARRSGTSREGWPPG